MSVGTLKLSTESIFFGSHELVKDRNVTTYQVLGASGVKGSGTGLLGKGLMSKRLGFSGSGLEGFRNCVNLKQSRV